MLCLLWIAKEVHCTIYYINKDPVITDFAVYEKISGRIPVILGNSYISLKIKGVFPVIVFKSLDFVLI